MSWSITTLCTRTTFKSFPHPKNVSSFPPLSSVEELQTTWPPFIQVLKEKFLDLPHVDQVLGHGHSVGISANRDCPVCVACLTLLAVGDPDHGPGDLADFGDFGASLADNATDQVVWHSHLLLLGVGLRSSRWIGRPQLRAGQSGQRCNISNGNQVIFRKLVFHCETSQLTNWINPRSVGRSHSCQSHGGQAG